MVSSYSPSLKLELMATGDQSGTWGDTTNTNIGTLLEQAITGYVAVAQGDVANKTLTSLNGASDEARNMVVDITGAMTAARNVVVPTAEKIYLAKNSTTGGFAVTFKTTAGTGIAVPAGQTRWLFCDGTNVLDGLLSYYTAGGTDVAIADGGTGASTAVGANNNLSITGANIASSATVDLATATGNNITVTGTTTITSFGTVQSGAVFNLTFSGILTLTYNATSLILPGAANIVTQVGDILSVQSLGSGNWQALRFQRAGSVQNDVKATDIASAATTDLATATGNVVHITGTTTIASFGTAAAGVERTLVFDGILTITNNNTSLILPQGVNLITSAGDTIIFRSEGSGNWRLISYVTNTNITTRWISYTPTFTGFGTPANVLMYSRRNGPNLEVQGSFTSGTSTAVTASMTLGFNGVNANVSIHSRWASAVIPLSAMITQVNGATSLYVIAYTAGGSVYFSAQNSASNGFTQALGNSIGVAGNALAFTFTVPINGWD